MTDNDNDEETVRVHFIRSFLAACSAGIAATAMSLPAQAEVKEVSIARQYGVSYLPFMVMEQNRLLEKHARAAGLGEIRQRRGDESRGRGAAICRPLFARAAWRRRGEAFVAALGVSAKSNLPGQ